MQGRSRGVGVAALLFVVVCSLSPGIASAQGAAAAPDERILWNMLHNNKLQLLRQAIESWRREYPGWQPPAEMVKALRDKEIEKTPRIKTSLCRDLDGLAARLPDDGEERLSQLQRTLADCTTVAERDAVLEIAQPLLAPKAFDALPGHEVVEYPQHRHWLTRWIDSNDRNAVAELLAHMDATIHAHQDAALASAIAWHYFNNEERTAAIEWFEKGRQWQPGNDELIYGLVLSLYKEGRLDEARLLAQRHSQEVPRLQPLLSDILMEQGWRQYEQQRYSESLESARTARSLPSSSQKAELLMAWSYYQMDDLANSRLLAERQRSQQLLELIAVKERERIPPPAAAGSAASIPPPGIDSASLEAGLAWRSKSGTEGTSRLDIRYMPVVAGHYLNDSGHEFLFTAIRTELRSGMVNLSGEPVGSAGLGPQVNVVAPNNVLDNGMAYRFDYRKRGGVSPSLSFGVTPDGGAVNRAITYELGLKQQLEEGYVRFALYGRPVRDSVLSYTGMRDPYSNTTWGRVRRQGVEVEQFYQGDGWNTFLNVTLASLNGESVANNTMYGLGASLSRDLHLKGFSYISVGPEFAWQHYDRNLSHFTLGHGGYFSPALLRRFGVGANLLTAEGRRHVVKGRFSFGYQSYEEAAEPWFPNTRDFNPALTFNGAALTHDDHRDSGLVYEAEIKGVRLLTDRWQLSGGMALRDSNGYSDHLISLGARYYFDRHRTSSGADIPEWMFDTLF